ncbi:MAG: 5'/3'-nucleotidase SurE [Dehalococcoidia bacterium]
MKILATNDDGVYSDGLWRLVEALKEVGEVIVSAPDREQSAVGTSVTLHHPLRMRKVEPGINGVETYSVEGTPADSVILGLQLTASDGVDMVISGINEGANLGNDVYISGTLGAAIQGHFYGIPAIAVSAALYEEKVRFEAAAGIAELLARKVKSGELPDRALLNVNIPYLATERIEGVELTRPGRRTYHDAIERGHDGKRDYYWIVRGEPVWEEKEGTDIRAIQSGRISITPLPISLPGPRANLLAELCSSLYEELKNRKHDR